MDLDGHCPPDGPKPFDRATARVEVVKRNGACAKIRGRAIVIAWTDTSETAPYSRPYRIVRIDSTTTVSQTTAVYVGDTTTTASEIRICAPRREAVYNLPELRIIDEAEPPPRLGWHDCNPRRAMVESSEEPRPRPLLASRRTSRPCEAGAGTKNFARRPR